MGEGERSMGEHVRPGRDDRFDLFRGLALIAISLNHIVPPAAVMATYGQYQLQTGLFFNFADVFVFISGCVGGIAYWKFLHNDGFAKAQLKSWKRISEIYSSHIASCLACLVLVFVFSRLGVTPEFLHWTANHLLSSAAGTFLIYNPMPFFNILGLYIVLLLLLPAYLWVYRHNRWLAGGLTLLVYLYSQSVFYLGKADNVASPFFGNLFAWQFIFFVGVSLGVEIRRGGLKLPANNWMIGATLLYFLVGDFLEQTEFAYFHFTSKDFLGAMRITDLLAAVYLISLWVPRTFGGRSAFVLPLIHLGRRALPVFCGGIVASYSASLLLTAVDAGRELYLATAVAIALAFYMVGLTLERRQRLQASTAINNGQASFNQSDPEQLDGSHSRPGTPRPSTQKPDKPSVGRTVVSGTIAD